MPLRNTALKPQSCTAEVIRTWYMSPPLISFVEVVSQPLSTTSPPPQWDPFSQSRGGLEPCKRNPKWEELLRDNAGQLHTPRVPTGSITLPATGLPQCVPPYTTGTSSRVRNRRSGGVVASFPPEETPPAGAGEGG